MLIGFVTAVPYTIVMMLVVKDIDAVRNAHLPSLELFHQATGSKTAALGLQCLLTVLFYCAHHLLLLFQHYLNRANTLFSLHAIPMDYLRPTYLGLCARCKF